MVWKCCVPECKSKYNVPVHRFPANPSRVDHWLKAIYKTELIGAPKEKLAKLRICTEHFSDDMILPYGPKRRLIDNAIPNLNLPFLNTIQYVDINVNDNFDEHTYVMENVPNNSDFVPLSINMSEDTPHNEPERRGFHLLKMKLKAQRKMLFNKKRIIYNQRKEINRLRYGNMWDDITKDMSIVQKTFIEMLTTNFKCAPQDNRLQIKRVNKRMSREGPTAYTSYNTAEHVLIQYEHRYKEEQKALALTLYKTMGKHAYTCLRKIFTHIPSIQTLQSVLHKIPFSTGLNTFILKHLKNISPKMSMKDKVCILMWNKISIQPKITYDNRKDIICGLEDWGNNRSGKMADHALVFMLRGLYSGWKMPISYSFCYRQTSSAQLIRSIKKHISNINNIGFHIVATVCDQGSSNVTAINELLLRTNMKRNFQRRTQRQTFEIANKEIIPLYDPHYLIKCIRNNLLTKNLALKYKEDTSKEVASWDIIKTAWIIDRDMNKIRPQLKKLDVEHIIENKIKKMPVKNATQVLSGTVASYIETLTRSKCAVTINDNKFEINMIEGLATAKAVNFFNDLFDSVNGNVKEITDENELRRPVTENSAHHMFWVSAKHVLRDMSFIDKITHEIVKKVSSLSNWIFTIDGFQKIWTSLNLHYGFRKLNMRYCNQDPLENFFGLIRNHAVRYTNPTPQQFEDSFITLLISNMKSISVVGGNCEAVDDSFMLFSLEEYLRDGISNVKVSNIIRKDSCTDEPPELISNNVVNEKSIITSLSEYLTETINLILKQVNFCSECNKCMKNSEFFICVKQLVGRANKLLRTRSHRRNISYVLLQHFKDFNVNMSWHECIEHHAKIREAMMRVIVIQTIVWWCERKNNINSDNKIDLAQCEAKKNIIEIKRMRILHKLGKYKRKEMLEIYKHTIRENRQK